MSSAVVSRVSPSIHLTKCGGGVVYSVAFKADVSQRRFESGRWQTVTVTACTLWQDSSNLSVTFSMTTADDETDVKLNIFIYLFICSLVHGLIK